MSSEKRFRIGVDTGGTFVDAVEFDEETRKFRMAKSPTTPSDPTIGFLNALQKLGTPLDQTYLILHGTTLGVNAIIQMKGVLTGMITNQGFKDVFEIGRGDVPSASMYDYNYLKPPRIVKRRHIAEIPGRIDHEGNIIRDLDEQAANVALRRLVDDQKVRSIAVSLLHSYKNADHEERIKSIASKTHPNLSVSISSEVVSEYREYERTSTTVLDAYIKPIIAEYLHKLERTLSVNGFKGVLLITRSDGGMMTAATAANSPISTVQSGPAGGVVGGSHLAALTKRQKLITMDIGGTSLDVCVIEDGQANVIHQSQVEHYPLLLTMYDVRSIGAGGGSIATVKTGLLQVGPESAGADPGPMCYGRGGTRPTVTDASVILGYIDPETFLAGDMPLKPELAREGIAEEVVRPLGVDLVEAAAGIMKVTAANSMGAIKQITVEEGRDPAEYALLAFGGAGPLFGAILALELGIPTVIVPSAPAAFSALGMLMSDISYEVSQTDISVLEESSIEGIRKFFAPLESRVRGILLRQEAPFKKVRVHRLLELRYLGQEHSLEISIDDANSVSEIKASFDAFHFKRYGHKIDDLVEIVNFRARAVGLLEKPDLPKLAKATDATPPPMKRREAYCLTSDKMTDFGVYRREQLKPGHVVEGPAIIDEGVTRTVIHTGQSLNVDEIGNLVITA